MFKLFNIIYEHHVQRPMSQVGRVDLYIKILIMDQIIYELAHKNMLT